MKRILRGVLYATTAIFAFLALFKVFTGIDLTNLRQLNHGSLQSINFRLSVDPTWDPETKTLTDPDGKIEFQGLEVQEGRTGTYKHVAILKYRFTAGEKGVKPRDVLIKHFSAKQGEAKLIEGMMNEASPAELIKAQNDSVLVAERGATLDLVEVYELIVDDPQEVVLTENITNSTVATAARP